MSRRALAPAVAVLAVAILALAFLPGPGHALPGAAASAVQEGQEGQETGDERRAGEAAYIAPDDAALPGFTPAAAERQRAYERALAERILPDSLARWARGLAAHSRLAGTPEARAARDSAVRWMREAGAEAAYDTFVVYLPHPIEVSVARAYPEPRDLPLEEPPLPDDPHAGETPPPVFNGYGASGEAEAELVYANYGLPEDYARLDSLGISVEGRIVLARYGRSYRGIKAREAGLRGAAALLLYSDPADDGYRRGDPYPEGPMRPPEAVQRGSVLDVSGDPSTPGWPSLPGAERLDEADMPGLARLPVVPLGYGAAEALLGPLEGPGAPAEWQGALPFYYRVGPGPARARVSVRREEGQDAYRAIHNTIAVVRGSEWPDEWVVVGGHRDAWGHGANDNASGTAAVLAAGRAMAALAAAGRPPRRTVVFATWDAEEWGLIGSTEWVERHAEALERGGVAYLNQDGIATGDAFSAGAAPPLKPLLRAAAAAVPDPKGRGSVLDAWRARHEEAAGGRAGGGTGGLPEPEVPVGDLGGGSDHKPFYQALGVPAASHGFGGSWGVYHSAYDTPAWIERFGDPGYRAHTASARVAALAAARLANADLLPYDFVAMGGQLERMVAELAEEGPEVEAALPPVLEAAGRFREAAERWAAAADSTLAEGPIPPDRARLTNAALRQVNRSFLAPEPMEEDPLARQLLFVSDPANGYATLGLPRIRLALRAGDAEAVGAALTELREALEGARSALFGARAALAGVREHPHDDG